MSDSKLTSRHHPTPESDPSAAWLEGSIDETSEEQRRLRAKNWKTTAQQADDHSSQGNIHLGTDTNQEFLRPGQQENGPSSLRIDPDSPLPGILPIRTASGKVPPGSSQEEQPETAGRAEAQEPALPPGGSGNSTFSLAETATVPETEEQTTAIPASHRDGRGRKSEQLGRDQEESSPVQQEQPVPAETAETAAIPAAASSEATVAAGPQGVTAPAAPLPSQDPADVPPDDPETQEAPLPQQAAAISGTGGQLSEDQQTTLEGQLRIDDPNPGEGFFQPVNIVGEYGTFALSKSGSWSYSLDNEQQKVQQLAEGQVVIDTITVSSSDGTSHHLDMSIQGRNDSPTLEIVSQASVDEDGSKQISFTASDLEGTVDTQATAQHGAILVDQDGTITYTPDSDYSGSDQITVTSSDQSGAQVIKSVAITVNEVNDPPTLEILSQASVDEDGSKQISFTASDLEGAVNTQATAQHGAILVDQDGTITYTPESDYSGSDQITVTSSDQSGAQVIKSVAITVNEVNDPPTLEILSQASVDQNGSKQISFTASDLEGTVNTQATAQHGAILVDQDGTITYTPESDYSGSDQITVTSSDENGAEVVKSVVVTVNEVNDPPTLEIITAPLLEVNLGASRTTTPPSQSFHFNSESANVYTFNNGASTEDENGVLNLQAGTPGNNLNFNNDNPMGVASAGEKKKDQNLINDDEALVLDFEQNIEQTEVTYQHLKGESTSWTAYDQDGQVVDSGTIRGPDNNGEHQFTITPQDNFQYLAIQGNSGAKANGFTLKDVRFTPEEGVEYPLNIASTAFEQAEADQASVTISDLPQGGTLSQGTCNPDGSWTLTPEETGDLTLTVPNSNKEDFELSVSTSFSDENGETQRAEVSVSRDDSGTGADGVQLGAGANYQSGEGNDRIEVSSGSQNIDGGTGTDTVIFHGNAQEYSLTKGDASLTVSDSVEGRDGQVSLTQVETLTFADQELSVADFLADPLTANFRFNDADGTYTYNTGGEVKDEARLMGDAHLEEGVLTLDGDGDFLKVTSSTDINLTATNQRTTSIWLKSEQQEGTMMVYEEGGEQAGLNIYIDEGKLYVGGYNSRKGELEGGFILAETDSGEPLAIADGKWHHVAVTLNSDPPHSTQGLRGYLDGQQFGASEAIALGIHPDPTGIGGINGTSLIHNGEVATEGMFFHGQLDDARIYAAALDEQAILELYQEPPDGITIGADDGAEKFSSEAPALETINIELPSIAIGAEEADAAAGVQAESQEPSTEKPTAIPSPEPDGANESYREDSNPVAEAMDESLGIGESLKGAMPSTQFEPPLAPQEHAAEALAPEGALDQHLREEEDFDPDLPSLEGEEGLSHGADAAQAANSSAAGEAPDQLGQTVSIIIPDSSPQAAAVGQEQSEALESYSVSSEDQDAMEIPAMDETGETAEASMSEVDEIGLGHDDAAAVEDIQEPAQAPEELSMI
ncbi:tandem-95 repeat protein [Desulfogranum mediterraneum]|uniref:tandem-95 repeat protein n=1 Tax=Desulfogranum mediterraneum TaxID=160661 RepID=UPI00041340DD|nr:tandem-95 repeat protein [Desulfogranum mediterraneum]